jgi:hypothetical protein
MAARFQRAFERQCREYVRANERRELLQVSELEPGKLAATAFGEAHGL